MTRLVIFSFHNDISIDLIKFFPDTERIKFYKIEESDSKGESSGSLNKIHKNKLIDTINQIIDKYDNILIIKGDEKLSDNRSESALRVGSAKLFDNLSASGGLSNIAIRYYKGMDSVGGDLEQTNNNHLNIIQKMIQREDYLAVNTLGYVKNRLNKIEKNYYLRDGGIWVKSPEKSSLYITQECLSLLNIQDFEWFNVLV